MKKLAIALLLLTTGTAFPKPITTEQRNTYALVTAAISTVAFTAYTIATYQGPTLIEVARARDLAIKRKIVFTELEYLQKHKVRSYAKYMLGGLVAGAAAGALIFFVSNTFVAEEKIKTIKLKVKKIKHGRIMSHADNIFNKENSIDKNGIIRIADLNYEGEFKVKDLYVDLAGTRDDLKKMKNELLLSDYDNLKDRTLTIKNIELLEHKLATINRYIRDSNLYKFNYKKNRIEGEGVLGHIEGFIDFIGEEAEGLLPEVTIQL